MRIQRTVIAFLAWFGMCLTDFPSSAAQFFWPDSQVHRRVILSADQGIVRAMEANPDWFENDFLIAGFYIKDVVYGQSETAISDFIALVNRFHFEGTFIGTAVSGTTAIHEPDITTFPDNAVSIENLSVKMHYLGPWIRDPKQSVVDLNDPFSRSELENAIALLWQHSHVNVHFVDNAAVHPAVYPLQSWANYCQNIKALRIYAEALGTHAIFNIYVRAWQMTEPETKQLIDAVAGSQNNAVSLPLPWSRELKDDKNADGWAKYRYRQMLDSGIVLILIPSADANEEDLYKWLATWRKPTDRIYMGIPYWQEPMIH